MENPKLLLHLHASPGDNYNLTKPKYEKSSFILNGISLIFIEYPTTLFRSIISLNSKINNSLKEF